MMLLWTLIGTVFAALAFLIIFLYFFRQGQFDGGEEVKYQIFYSDKDPPKTSKK